MTEEVTAIEAPIPKDLATAIRQLEKYAPMRG